MTIAENTFPVSLDGDASLSSYTWMAYGVAEALTRITPGMKIEPWLASRVDPVDDLTWRVSIRDGVTFSDGSAVDSAAVKTSLERSLAMQPASSSLLPAGTRLTADGLKLEIHTPVPVPTMPTSLSAFYFAIKKVTADGRLLYTGPVLPADFVAGQSVVLNAYEGYRGGPANLRSIKVLRVLDVSSRVLALQSGDVQLAMALLPSDVEKLKAGGQLRDEPNPGAGSRCPVRLDGRLRDPDPDPAGRLIARLLACAPDDLALRRRAALDTRAGHLHTRGHRAAGGRPRPTHDRIADPASPSHRSRRHPPRSRDGGEGLWRFQTLRSLQLCHFRFRAFLVRPAFARAHHGLGGGQLRPPRALGMRPRAKRPPRAPGGRAGVAGGRSSAESPGRGHVDVLQGQRRARPALSPPPKPALAVCTRLVKRATGEQEAISRPAKAAA